MHRSNTLTDHALRAAEVCPKPIPGAQPYMDDITGWIMTGVLWMIGVAVLVAVGAVIGGRMFNMPHASKVGIISMAFVFFGAVAYMVVPPIVRAVTGDGCV